MSAIMGLAVPPFPRTLDELLALPPGVWTPLPVLAALVVTYVLAARRFDTDRARAYILSAISAAVLSVTSLPFVYIWLTGGFEAAWKAGQTGWTATMAQYVIAFFGTYLFGESRRGRSPWEIADACCSRRKLHSALATEGS